MRSFFAIYPSEAVAARLGVLVPPLPGTRRLRPDRIHLSLRVMEAAPDDLGDRVNFGPLPAAFSLKPGKFLLLPESGPVKMIASSLVSDLPPLRALQMMVEVELTRLGLGGEARLFHPYLVLARCEPPLPQQIRARTPYSPREDLSFEVTSFRLVQSRADETGAMGHHVIREWRLS